MSVDIANKDIQIP